jgi:hypothetical protein
MTRIFFAVADETTNKATFGRWDWDTYPLNILVAFPYIHYWTPEARAYNHGRTMLDSGAYSAWGSGKTIDMDALCQEANNPYWDEVVALDVIGDAEASMRNSLVMKARGLTVMPVFHFGDPWPILEEYKRSFGRIGLASGHGAPFHKRMDWTEQCFARAYPSRFHSFGWIDERPLFRFPFTTADSTSWYSPRRFGRSKSVPDVYFPTVAERGPEAYDVRQEVAHMLDLENRLCDRWRAEFTKTFPDEVKSLPEPVIE